MYIIVQSLTEDLVDLAYVKNGDSGITRLYAKVEAWDGRVLQVKGCKTLTEALRVMRLHFFRFLKVAFDIA
jgi:hypothetical protein